MTPEKFRLMSELYDAAAAMDPAQRTRFIEECCANDDALRRQLIDAFRDSGSALAGIVEKAAAAVVGGGDHWTGRRLGKYRILHIVGEGGMGVVYQAEQDHPRRIVALKVIKAGVPSGELLRRFERESEVLARLQHPGIAQIYEAGAAETSFGQQPYFAMEFIRGVPLPEYAESHRLSTRQRLELLAKVSDAVEHAHQRGIIHRDLKPGNILVDETGQPKILDFGVARVTDSDLQATRQTDIGQLVGTLAYMSPEQVTGDPLELDTRSDVYALGVILYELLANRAPYQLSHQLPEAVRAIREEDPTRLSSISRAYRGDVETIVSKALEKDKGRRYSSAAALADDIRRYLADQPITARPASTSYQLRKFARRHKALVGGVAAVFIVLVAGTVVSTWQAVRARRAERSALEAQQTAQAVDNFLQNDLLAQASASNQAGPNRKPDPDLKVRTALDRAAERIKGKFERQPEVEAAIRDTIGQTYMDLGLYPEARAQLERALEVARKTLGAEDTKTLKILGHLGRTAILQGRYPEAEALLSKALEIQRRILGVQHTETLDSLTYLASTYTLEGKYAQAEALNNQALAIRRRLLGPEHLDTLGTISNLASLYYFEGKYQQAEALGQQLLEIRRRVLGPEHPDTLSAMNNLANIYDGESKYAEAESLRGQALEIRRRILGPAHPQTLSTMDNLAVDYFGEGKYAQAELIGSRALGVQRRVLGPEHPQTIRTMNHLVGAYLYQGKYVAAEALEIEAVAIEGRILGSKHPETLEFSCNLAYIYAVQGKYTQAEILFRKTLDAFRGTLGPDHPQTIGCVENFCTMYQRHGNYHLAEVQAAQALASYRRALGSQHPDTMASAADLALAYISQSEFSEAEPLAREAMEFYQKNQAGNWLRFRAASLLGASLAGLKNYAAAESLLLAGYQGMLIRKSRIGTPDLYHLDRAREWLVQLYDAWSKPEKAAEWRNQKP
jgi:tetratricopeptide (TPR) repeat protein/predicted Ser/Thr protein kinase